MLLYHYAVVVKALKGLVTESESVVANMFVQGDDDDDDDDDNGNDGDALLELAVSEAL